MKTKFDLTQLKDNSDRTTCTVSVEGEKINFQLKHLPTAMAVGENGFFYFWSTVHHVPTCAFVTQIPHIS